MTLPQIFSFSIIAATMLLFVWGRLRYDLVALLALLAAIATGIVAPDKAFSGFSDDIVIIVACALLVSAAVGRSGVIEDALARLLPYLTTRTIQVAVLVGAVTALSAFVKNIGALAMLMPVAFSLARKTNGTPSIYLMGWHLARCSAASSRSSAPRPTSSWRGCVPNWSANRSACSTSPRLGSGSRSAA